ncbi:hypothetical protein [Bartonella sp. B39]
MKQLIIKKESSLCDLFCSYIPFDENGTSKVHLAPLICRDAS